mgnify:CR=1 FL=1
MRDIKQDYSIFGTCWLEDIAHVFKGWKDGRGCKPLTYAMDAELSRVFKAYYSHSGEMDSHGCIITWWEGATIYSFVQYCVVHYKEILDKWGEFVQPKQQTNGFNTQGLRYVSPEVGWVDQDDEYY